MEALRKVLFPGDDEFTYAVIDGASCEELLERLDEFNPRHYCLYIGELEPDVEEVAPYIVELLPDHPFTHWFLANSLGHHWGIFARSALGLRATRKHFRTFLVVKSDEDKPLYFRYYDPRVLRIFLPTCKGAEIKVISGPISRWVCEDETAGSVLIFDHVGNALAKSLLEGL